MKCKIFLLCLEICFRHGPSVFWVNKGNWKLLKVITLSVLKWNTFGYGPFDKCPNKLTSFRSDQTKLTSPLETVRNFNANLSQRNSLNVREDCNDDPVRTVIRVAALGRMYDQYAADTYRTTRVSEISQCRGPGQSAIPCRTDRWGAS